MTADAFDDTIRGGERRVGDRPAADGGARPAHLHHGRRRGTTVDAIVAHGGEIVQPIGGDAPEITARFRDPGGNVLGIYQQPS